MTIKPNQVCLKKNSDVEIICLCSKTCCYYNAKSHKNEISNNGLNKRTLEGYGCKLIENIGEQWKKLSIGH